MIISARAKRQSMPRLPIEPGQVLSKTIGDVAHNYWVSQVSNFGTAVLIPISLTGDLKYTKNFTIDRKSLQIYARNPLLERLLLHEKQKIA